jgi:hypothetical protein
MRVVYKLDDEGDKSGILSAEIGVLLTCLKAAAAPTALTTARTYTAGAGIAESGMGKR